ncbi:MAG: C4-type zinc ribbon domain-containing protein [Vicinamibacterales bacterium]
MLPALASLVALQDVASRAEDARRRIADAPGRIEALNDQLAAATRALDDAKAALAASQAARRDLEKEAAVAQQRVSKYKDQLMEAKDNRQYHALQHEIATFGEEVSRVEGQIIERMVEADELGAKVKAAEAGLAKDKQSVAAQKSAIEAEAATLTASLAGLTAERESIGRDLPPAQLSTFDTLFKARKGLALAKVVDGLCEACRMRVRPHLYNQIRAGDQIIQCESCQRILYYVPPPKPDEQAVPGAS